MKGLFVPAKMEISNIPYLRRRGCVTVTENLSSPSPLSPAAKFFSFLLSLRRIRRRRPPVITIVVRCCPCGVRNQQTRIRKRLDKLVDRRGLADAAQQPVRLLAGTAVEEVEDGAEVVVILRHLSQLEQDGVAMLQTVLGRGKVAFCAGREARRARWASTIALSRKVRSNHQRVGKSGEVQMTTLTFRLRQS